ncbi:MAG: endonuclease/exonuclease/phosphatase family protein [Bacteroidetes bacterium]|nr:MAG: endonuclease/exonuclease/phosphatase family protein [Bacteroidota bacterium]
MRRKIFKITGWVTGLFLLYIGGVLVYGTLTDWQPRERKVLKPIQAAGESVVTDSIISLVSWNIGYAGLGAESDFFFDNGGTLLSKGHMIRPPEELSQKNLDGASLFTRTTASDIFLFQEVDREARRSYYRNQVDSLRKQRPDYHAVYAANYKVNWVPIPLLEPWRAYGKVEAGLLSLSRWQPTEQVRLQLPGDFPWPTRIFQLDRCLLLSRYRTDSDKELVVINAHLSAYDATGELKRQQMAYLRELVKAEYAAGNYVIVGADWNQCPPHFPFDTFSPGNTQGYHQYNIEAEFLGPDWQWLYDPTIPSNRKLRTPYDPQRSFQTIIDFFLLSPNVRAKRVKTIDQQFRFSDHQPVWVEVELVE